MSEGQTDYKAFRRRLDDVLRQKDPVGLHDFLVAEGQWQQGASTNAEAAMWMMIAASPALRDLHEEAQRWLVSHGHETEAQAILGRRVGGGGALPGAPHSKQTRTPGGQRHAPGMPAPGMRTAASRPPARDHASRDRQQHGGSQHRKGGPKAE